MIVYETTPCEVCSEPLSKGDPGNWWIVRLRGGRAEVPLHERMCRSEWFLAQPVIYSFHKDKRIEDVI